MNTHSGIKGAYPAPAPIEWPDERARAHAGRVDTSWTHVAIALDSTYALRLHAELAATLSQSGCHVSIAEGAAIERLPLSVLLLLARERLTGGLPSRLLGERITVDTLAAFPRRATQDSDLLVDLFAHAPAAANVLHARFDGASGYSALFSALVAGRMPTIEIICGNDVLARGTPSADNARTLSEALDFALARLITLTVAVVSGARPLGPLTYRGDGRFSVRTLAATELRSLAHSAARSLYHLCCYAPHWRVMWRKVDGSDLWDARTLDGTEWNVLADPGDRFYADPFPFEHDGRVFLFVEDFSHRTGKGIISVVPFGDNGPIGGARPALEEPWHLSYPFVFAAEGAIWMVPESSGARRVVLYRAERFPDRWVQETVLLEDVAASDATILRHGDRYWTFATIRDGRGSWSDTLHLYSAEKIRGPWTPHPANPVLVDAGSARPAGGMVARNGRLFRPVQDCEGGYGTGIGLAEVTRLDDSAFEQVAHATLRAPAHWPGRRLHTLNACGEFEFIDGAAHSPRRRLLARLLESRSGRREAR